MRVRATACLVAILLAPPLAAQDTGMGVTSTGVPSMGVPSTGVPSMARHYMARMDEDGDARISLAEYQDWMGYAFAQMDRNGDGVLSPAEQPGGRGAAITREAHRALLAARFHRQDANRDGFLDARELAAPPR